MVVPAFNPALLRERQMELCELEAGLVCIANSSRTSRSYIIETLSQTTTSKNNDSTRNDNDNWDERHFYVTPSKGSARTKESFCESGSDGHCPGCASICLTSPFLCSHPLFALEGEMTWVSVC